MPTRASKHKQGMAKEHEPKPATAIATGIEGPRTDYEHQAHNADRGNALKNQPPSSLHRPSTQEEAANAGENVDAAKEHAKNKKPPTPRNGT